MDTLILLERAEAAGLVVTDRGHQIHIRGPKRAEPLVQQLIKNKHAVLVALKERAGWDRETASLIQWFLDEGQHRFPVEPFRLSPWQLIVNPHLFKESILFGISMGPEKIHILHGTITADLRRLKELFDNNPTSEEESS